MEDNPSGQGNGGGGGGIGTAEGAGRRNRQQPANRTEASNKRLKTTDQQPQQLARLDPSTMPVPLPQPNPLPNMSPNAQLSIPGGGVGVQSSSNTAGLDLSSFLNNRQTSTTVQSPTQDGKLPSITPVATTAGAGASSTTDHNSSQQLTAFSPLNTSQHNFLNFSTPQFQQQQFQSVLAQQATFLQMQQQTLQQQGHGQRGPSSSQHVPLGAGPGSINNAALLQYVVQQNQALMAALASQQHDSKSTPMTTASVASPSAPSAGLGQQHQQQQQLPSLQAQLAILRNPQLGGGSSQHATMTPNAMIPQSGTGNSRVATSSTTWDGSLSVATDTTATTGPDKVNNPSTDSAASKQLPTSSRRPSLLFMPCDHDSLSQYQCLVRKQIEIFEATQLDVESSAKGRNRPIVLGQVSFHELHEIGILTWRRQYFEFLKNNFGSLIVVTHGHFFSWFFSPLGWYSLSSLHNITAQESYPWCNVFSCQTKWLVSGRTIDGERALVQSLRPHSEGLARRTSRPSRTQVLSGWRQEILGGRSSSPWRDWRWERASI